MLDGVVRHELELRDPDVVKPPNPANDHIILEDED